MDLKQHLLRQMAFSHATFGPGTCTDGVIDHIRKELVEVAESNGASDEWVDVVILALDGLTRQLAFCNGSRANPEIVAETACDMIVGKQGRNEGRAWPDWRTAAPGKAIEHVKAPAGDGLIEWSGGECPAHLRALAAHQDAPAIAKALEAAADQIEALAAELAAIKEADHA